MSETRKDHKGRKLWNGESQRKDGKYEYKYQDACGKRKTVYSWKLTPSDTMPKGKRESPPCIGMPSRRLSDARRDVFWVGK